MESMITELVTRLAADRRARALGASCERDKWGKVIREVGIKPQ